MTECLLYLILCYPSTILSYFNLDSSLTPPIGSCLALASAQTRVWCSQLSQPSLHLAASASKGLPHGTPTLPSSYVNASKLSSRGTEQLRWKEHESRARNACKIGVRKHLFFQTEAGKGWLRGEGDYASVGSYYYFQTRQHAGVDSWQQQRELNVFQRSVQGSIKYSKCLRF